MAQRITVTLDDDLNGGPADQTVRFAAQHDGTRWLTAWIGSAVADVMVYVRGVPMIGGLAAKLSDWVLTGRMMGTIPEQYAARQPRRSMVRAAAWLVTAHRA